MLEAAAVADFAVVVEDFVVDAVVNFAVAVVADFVTLGLSFCLCNTFGVESSETSGIVDRNSSCSSSSKIVPLSYSSSTKLIFLFLFELFQWLFAFPIRIGDEFL